MGESRMRDPYLKDNNFLTYAEVRSDQVLSGTIADPDITIFIPTFKRADTLQVSIDSTLNQIDGGKYEVVIVNNDPEGAKGETREIIDRYNDPRISYYVNQKNIGLCGNWNRGIELARGKYVAMIHDDDMLSPWFLKSIREAIRKNQEPAVIGVSFVNFDSNHIPQFTEPAETKYRRVTKESYFFGKYINIAGMTVQKDFMINQGGYRDEYYPNEDSILIYQAILNGDVVNIEHVLAGYRQEVNLSLSEKTMKEIIRKTEETRRYIAKHETFAHNWMKRFDKEYLNAYIEGANQYWGLQINPDEMLHEFGFDNYNVSKLKTIIMKSLLKLKMSGRC